MTTLEPKLNKMNDHSYGSWWGIIPGLFGGIYKLGHPLQITSTTEFMERLYPAFITAFLCGIAGAIGKWLFDITKDFIKRKINK